MSVRAAGVIGGLWPRCKSCGHIAQAHDTGNCSELTHGQCPTCGLYGGKVPCPCQGYDGPSLKEFMEKNMTPEEIAYYSKQWGVIHERS